MKTRLIEVPEGLQLLSFKGIWGLECYRPSMGRVAWVASFENLIPNEGLNRYAGILFYDNVGWPKIDDWYIGIIEGSTAPVATDTLASFGFTEFTNYTGNRKQWITGAPSGQQITTLDPASRAEFDFLADKDVTGLMLTDQETGYVGTLGAAGLLSVAKSVLNGDTLRVTYTIQLSSV